MKDENLDIGTVVQIKNSEGKYAMRVVSKHRCPDGGFVYRLAMNNPLLFAYALGYNLANKLFTATELELFQEDN